MKSEQLAGCGSAVCRENMSQSAFVSSLLLLSPAVMNVYLNDGDKQADYTIHVSGTHTPDSTSPQCCTAMKHLWSGAA